MSRKWFAVHVIVSCLLGGNAVRAQQAPDTILYNGKVVTVDNHEVNEQLGTIAQALAIKGNAIVAVGTNARIRAMSGPNTKSIDLKGRMVAPGFSVSHDHPHDWDPLNPYIMQKVVNDNMHIERFLWDESPDEKVQKFPRILDEAVRKAKPNQWIRISLLFGKEYQWSGQVSGLLGRQINKQMLDLVAPNNPVIVRGGLTVALLNQKAIDETKKHYGDQWTKFVVNPFQLYAFTPEESNAEQMGVCRACYREIETDVIYAPDVLREMFRMGLSWEAGYGYTFVGTSLYSGGTIRAYSSLDRQGQMPIRLGWGWSWPERNDLFFDPYFVQALVSQEGKGSDYFWITGMTSHMGGGCSKLPATSPEIQERDCYYRGFTDPIISRALYEYIKAGGRLAGDHMIGDDEIDLVLDIIEKASKDAGMTLDEIRSKRHVTEHMAMYPRPDQIPRFKNLGIMTSGFDMTIWGGAADRVLRDYGERGAMQVLPRKSLYEAGIMNAVELDRPHGYTNLTHFYVLYSGITRKNKDGHAAAPQQAINRQAMLKAATLFGAYYAKREDKFGSLEPGKFADLMILDRDYLTVPVDDILKIRVLMTMVGGKIQHLVPSLAREWGMQPTGAQVELGGPAAQW